MNNEIKDTWQLNSILDLYNGKENYQTVNTAKDYYINHNSIPNGVVLSNKITPINGVHKISNAYYYYDNNDYDTKNDTSKPYNNYYPLLTTYDVIDYQLSEESQDQPTYQYYKYYPENNYKILSAKDIDFENAYLKYANQTHDYHAPIEYYELSVKDNKIYTYERINDSYIFDREISPYVNNTYDLLNIVDYLCNRINCLNFLLEVIKEQKNTEFLN